MIDINRFGYLLDAHLRDHKMSQNEMARKIGVNSTAISQYVTGRNSPKLNTFLKIVDAFDMTPDQFFQIPQTAPKQAPVEPEIIEVPVEVEKVVYRDKEPEVTEWVEDAEHVLYCRACRCDAPYGKDGQQYRPRFCPVCGRRREAK